MAAQPTDRIARVLAVALGVLAVVLGLLLFWPRGGGPEAPAPKVAQQRPRPRPIASAQVAEAPPPTEARQQVVVLDDLPPNASANCKQVVTWARRNVPGWVIEDNMGAQGMKFSEEEMACLEAGHVPDQVLDWAQWNMRVPQDEKRNDPILPPAEE